eukprot:308880_1
MAQRLQNEFDYEMRMNMREVPRHERAAARNPDSEQNSRRPDGRLMGAGSVNRRIPPKPSSLFKSRVRQFISSRCVASLTDIRQYFSNLEFSHNEVDA